MNMAQSINYDRKKQPITSHDYVGTFHTFGKEGIAYEVLSGIDENTVTIRIVETGETLPYKVEQLLADPVA